MAAIEAIIYNGFHTRSLNNPGTSLSNYFPPGYLLASSLTAGDTYIVKHIADGPPVVATTAGQFIAVASKGLAPFASGFSNRSYLADWPVTSSAVSVGLFAILTDASVTVATAYMRPSYPYSHGLLADWSITQTSDKSVVVRLQTLNTPGSHTVLYSLTDEGNYASSGGANKPSSRPIYTVEVIDNTGTQLATADLHWAKNGINPVVTFPSSTIVTSGNHVVKISNIVANPTSSATTLISQEIQTTLTASAVTSGGVTASMFSWLDNSYWYLTDLQVNLGTREVTHRHGTVEIKPNDTINFAVLFHNGSAGVDPVATDLRLAVRSASNASAYHFWSAATVTTAAVSGDTYYTITVTASDDDLLAAQAAGLLAGSNAAQSLLGEIQWTTTRGTFSSDTFTISVPNEVVRETDV